MFEEMKEKIEGTLKDNQEHLNEKEHILRRANDAEEKVLKVRHRCRQLSEEREQLHRQCSNLQDMVSNIRQVCRSLETCSRTLT